MGGNNYNLDDLLGKKMNSCNLFKLDVESLEYLSGVTLAISLWERPEVKQKISCGFVGVKEITCNPNELSEYEISYGQKVVNYVFQLLDSMYIPEHLLQNIKVIIVKIGQKIFYWRDYVINILRLNGEFAENIFWASNGQIDELRILQEFWLSNSTLPQENCECFRGRPITYYCLASRYGQENVVETHLESMKDLLLCKLNHSFRAQVWTPYTVIAAWLSFCLGLRQVPALNFFKNNTQPSDFQIMLKCIANGKEFGAKYFWNRLKGKISQKQTTEAAIACLKLGKGNIDTHSFYNHRCCETAFVKEIAIRLLLFFVNQMTEIEKLEFIVKNFISIFELLLQIWPFQQLCEKLLFQLWHHISKYEEKLLNLILDHVIFNEPLKHTREYFTTQNFYKKLLVILLQKISKNPKISRFTRNNYNNVSNLYKIFDIDILCLIINDADFEDHRDNILRMGNRYFRKLLLERKYAALNKFIKRIMYREEEVKIFKLNLNVLYEILISGDISAAEEHLNWLSDSEDKRSELKNKIDASDVSFFLFQNYKFGKVKKFLSWRFKTEEERLEILEPLKSKDLFMSKFFEAWGATDTKLCAKKCSKLLKWHFESKEKIKEFKRNLLIHDQLLVEKYWDALSGLKSLKYFDVFLKFCSMSSDEIDVMKINMANNINWWIDTYAYEKTDYFGMVHALLQWVYGENKQVRRRVIKSYMNSSRGTLLCLKVVKDCVRKSPSHILILFNSWIKPSYNFRKFKAHLDHCDKSVGDNVILCVTSMLKTRESDELVSLGHASYQDFRKESRRSDDNNYSPMFSSDEEEEEELVEEEEVIVIDG